MTPLAVAAEAIEAVAVDATRRCGSGSLNREWAAIDELATGSWPHRAKAVGLAPHEIDACECGWIGPHASHADHVRVMTELDVERIQVIGKERR